MEHSNHKTSVQLWLSKLETDSILGPRRPVIEPEKAIDILAGNTADWFPGEYAALPDHIKQQLGDYIMFGHRVDGSLYFVLTNNLIGVLRTAADEELEFLFVLISWILTQPPACCHSSDLNYEKWIEIGGLSGLAASTKTEADPDLPEAEGG